MIAPFQNMIAEAPPQNLLALLEQGSSPAGELWSQDEYAAVWRHQLTTPVVALLSDPNASRDAGAVCTVGQLISDDQPRGELVWLVSRYAKACTLDRGRALPQEVARVLYYLMIWVGRFRARQDQSTLSDADLLEGLRWSAQRPWLDEPTAAAIDEMIAGLA